MRVLHLTRDYPPRSHGGLSSAVASWVRAGQTQAVEAAIVSFDAYRPLAQGRGCCRIEPGEPAVLRVEGEVASEALLAFARTAEADLLHVHDGLLGEHAAWLRRALGVPWLHSVHVLQHQLLELRGLTEPTRSATAQAYAVRAADAVTAPSPSALARLREDCPDLPAARRVLPLCVVAAAGPQLQRPSPARVLYAGRFMDIKGTRDWLAALPAVARALPMARFELAGGMPASPRAERRFLRQQAGALPEDVAARVQWLGWCDAAALDAAYRRAWLLVAPSWTETFGQCVFEALARGTPVVATRVGAFSDYLCHGREGLLVRPRDEAALAGAARRVLEQPGLRERLAEGAVASSARFAPAEVGRLLAATYTRVLRQG